MIDFSLSLQAKQFFRFTGPPENWLTAIKYMTWGLEEKYRDRWGAIQPGDIFFIHSTSNSQFKNAKSGIIGIGVVGPDFSIKESHLWMEEIQQQKNKWPLLVPFSEIYLFSELPEPNIWEAPNPNNAKKTAPLIDVLLRNFIPLSKFPEFPKMGSFSAVKFSVAEKILNDKKPLYEYRADDEPDAFLEKPTALQEVRSAGETLRYADTLKIFDNIRERVVSDAPGTFFRNTELLARAEAAHATILQQLIDVFRKHGYNTLFNRHVDLFAFNERQSVLVEVKSTENRNFRTQARKGIVQLFEYDFFEVRKFVEEKKMNLQQNFKVLVPSSIPADDNYVKFINSLHVGVGISTPSGLNAVGRDLGFTKL